MEQKAREEAEKVRRDREVAAQKKEEERLARKKVKSDKRDHFYCIRS